MSLSEREPKGKPSSRLVENTYNPIYFKTVVLITQDLYAKKPELVFHVAPKNPQQSIGPVLNPEYLDENDNLMSILADSGSESLTDLYVTEGSVYGGPTEFDAIRNYQGLLTRAIRERQSKKEAAGDFPVSNKHGHLNIHFGPP